MIAELRGNTIQPMKNRFSIESLNLRLGVFLSRFMRLLLVRFKQILIINYKNLMKYSKPLLNITLLCLLGFSMAMRLNTEVQQEDPGYTYHEDNTGYVIEGPVHIRKAK